MTSSQLNMPSTTEKVRYDNQTLQITYSNENSRSSHVETGLVDVCAVLGRAAHVEIFFLSSVSVPVQFQRSKKGRPVLLCCGWKCSCGLDCTCDCGYEVCPWKRPWLVLQSRQRGRSTQVTQLPPSVQCREVHPFVFDDENTYAVSDVNTISWRHQLNPKVRCNRLAF